MLRDGTLLDKAVYITLETFPNKILLDPLIGCLHPIVAPHNTRLELCNQPGSQGRIVAYPD
jgi:hypothetical protein